MIQCELISTTTLTSTFHGFSEQLTGVNPASIVQSGRRPKSKAAYPLAYFRAFNDPQADTSDVRPLLGMMHFGMLCAGTMIDIVEVTGWPHGLRCLQGVPSRMGVSTVIMTGDGEQWRTALSAAGSGPDALREWGLACHTVFAKHNLDDLFGKLQVNRNARDGKAGGYYIEN